MNRLLISAAIFFWSVLSVGQTSKRMADLNWILQIGYGNSGSKIQHTETSAAVGFTALGGESSVANDGFTLTLLREFLNQKRLSFSVNGFAGIITGSGSGKVGTIDYKETAAGNHFGGGVSVNLNYYGYGMKIQPYLGFDFLLENIKYEMKYTASSTEIKTNYDYSGTLADVSLGVRLLDPAVNMMSFLSVSYLNALSQEATPTVVAGSNSGTLTGGVLTRNPLKISLGFGFLF